MFLHFSPRHCDNQNLENEKEKDIKKTTICAIVINRGT
jgi:hypothetical protein